MYTNKTTNTNNRASKMNRKRTLSSTTTDNQSSSSSSSSSDDDEAGSSTTTSHSTFHPSSKKKKMSESDHEQRLTSDGGPNSSPLSKYSDFAQKMMARMGYKKGKGLGKNESGRVDIVEASNQRGRRGLGLTLKGLEGKSGATWEEDEEIMIKQDPQWILSNTSPAPSLEDMNQWTNMSARKETIDDEFKFCEPGILKGVLGSKSVFDNLGHKEFLHARTRANPYETIRSAIFQNRAAMKMAEMDTSFDDMFTSHSDFNEKDPSALLYFADICAGPGGFSEYVLWRRKWRAKGFGFTLRAEGANDFKLEDFKAGTPETFDCHYGVGGYQGNGDIFREDNLREFRKYVMTNTDDEGVHFVMADGGFSVEGNENIQEILSKQLYLCQFICALSILREGGHFVCKLFDLFTPFSIGLVYLMYRAFDQVCIFKPVTSRPANSERYIVCKKYRSTEVSAIHDYLFELNIKLNKLKGSDVDIGEVVPVDIIKDDEPFFQYMFNSNNEIGARQILGLKKLATYVQNTVLVGPDQAEVRKQCLEAWNVPVTARANLSRSDPENQFEKIVNYSSAKLLSTPCKELTKATLNTMKSVRDYKWTYCGGERFYLFSLGRFAVFKWNPVTHSAPKFKRITERLELPRHTILDVEFVFELKGDARGQRKVMAIHVVDALQLGDEYIGDKPLSDRLKLIKTFVKALSKPCRTENMVIRVKDYHSLTDLDTCLNSLEVKIMKPRMESRLACIFKDNKYFVPTGVYLIRRVHDPWHLQFSRSSNRIYFYNGQTNKSVFEPTKCSIADAKYCVTSRVRWAWAEGGISQWDVILSLPKDVLVEFIESRS